MVATKQALLRRLLRAAGGEVEAAMNLYFNEGSGETAVAQQPLPGPERQEVHTGAAQGRDAVQASVAKRRRRLGGTGPKQASLLSMWGAGDTKCG